MNRFYQITTVVFLMLITFDIQAATPILPAVTLNTATDGTQTYSVTLQILALMTALSVLPALLMTLTSFTRIIIVLAILRQAMGLTTTPTNQILLGIALFMTFFIMAPVLNEVNETALQPYLAGNLEQTKALEVAAKPVKQFMINQTRDNDLNLFASLSNAKTDGDMQDIPITTLMPAFLTSELKTAFQIGFILFLPFLIIDLVVASVLMAMGMMMMSPMMISLPFKIMLFVLVDGWTLILGTLVSSFG